MHQTDYLRFAVLSANTQEALREISESTGGFIIANTNNSEALLTRVMEEVDTHFELAYRPASPTSDGHFRKIEVKLNKPDLRVQTRAGYYAVPETGEGPLTPGDMGALEALDKTPLPFDFGFESKAIRFRSAKGIAQYAIAFELPIANLTATAETPQKKHRFHAYLFALIKNAQGDIVDRVSKDVPSDVADNYLAGLRGETMIYEHAVNLPPGRYTVEAAVVDQEGNRSATSVFPLENRDQQGPGISDITLVRRVHDLKRAPDPADPFEIPGKRAQPYLATDLPAGAQPYIYFVVYPEQETLETALLQAQFIKDGQVLRHPTLRPPQIRRKWRSPPGHPTRRRSRQLRSKNHGGARASLSPAKPEIHHRQIAPSCGAANSHAAALSGGCTSPAIVAPRATCNPHPMHSPNRDRTARKRIDARSPGRESETNMKSLVLISRNYCLLCPRLIGRAIQSGQPPTRRPSTSTPRTSRNQRVGSKSFPVIPELSPVA